MPATTIDEILAELEKIIADCRQTNDRVGYFAALYHKVTSQVKQGIETGLFEDGPRMGRLDVLFASRYLDALDNWRKNASTTQSWKVALDATRSSSLLTLQHLLLGINAHINLDLGIAAVETIQGKQIQDIHKDFDSINAIIGSLTYQVVNEIDQVSPLLSLLGLHANQTESILIQFSIGNARDGAWCFAEDLSQLTGDAGVKAIQQRDQDIASLAAGLVKSRGFIRLTLWIIHLFEWKRPSRIIAVLLNYKKTVVKVSAIRGSGPS
jgi:hypothetical protein